MIHPSIEIPRGCSVGPGSIVLAGVVMTANVQVGSHVVAMPHVTLTHDDVVEDFVTLCAGVTLGGGVRLRNGAYLGMNASVRPGVTVGRDATLGMGAALVEDLPDRETWVGVPAHRLQTRHLREA
jgi:acetyltransferase-like isoleucine patch superfamily enzyme